MLSIDQYPTTPLFVSEKHANKVRTFLQENFKGSTDGGVCFFRRFERIVQHSDSSVIIKHIDEDTTEILNSLDGVLNDEINKNIEIVYKYFSLYATSRKVRQEPAAIKGKKIFCHSKNYAQIDMFDDYTFSFNSKGKWSIPCTPNHNDLLFIFISNESLQKYDQSKNNGKFPSAEKWCVISEQFLHTWTLLMHDWHETFDKIIANDTPQENKETELRDKIFKGNRIMTNSWLKSKLSLQSAGKTTTLGEKRNKYWFYRTEEASTNWVDIYAAIILLVRYRELPTPVNVPNNSGELNTIRRTSWSIPEKLMTMLFVKAGLKIDLHDIINYNIWKQYSDSTCACSYKLNRGFVDDIPIQKNLSEPLPEITITPTIIKNGDFPFLKSNNFT